MGHPQRTFLKKFFLQRLDCAGFFVGGRSLCHVLPTAAAPLSRVALGRRHQWCAAGGDGHAERRGRKLAELPAA